MKLPAGTEKIHVLVGPERFRKLSAYADDRGMAVADAAGQLLGSALDTLTDGRTPDGALPDLYIPKSFRPRPPRPPQSVTYSCGYEQGKVAIGFWSGPYPTLREALDEAPPFVIDDPAILVRNNADETIDVLYRWTGHAWKKQA